MLEKTLNMCLKIAENTEHIRCTFNEIKPSKAIVSINKTNIVIMTTDKCFGISPDIRKHKLK
jgi:hypothetical protein